MGCSEEVIRTLRVQPPALLKLCMKCFCTAQCQLVRKGNRCALNGCDHPHTTWPAREGWFPSVYLKPESQATCYACWAREMPRSLGDRNLLWLVVRRQQRGFKWKHPFLPGFTLVHFKSKLQWKNTYTLSKIKFCLNVCVVPVRPKTRTSWIMNVPSQIKESPRYLLKLWLNGKRGHTNMPLVNNCRLKALELLIIFSIHYPFVHFFSETLCIYSNNGQK